MPKRTGQQGISPRGKQQTAKRATRSTVNRRGPLTRRARVRGVQEAKVHRRLVLYPSTTDSKWLDTLSWYGSIGLKLFSLFTSVSDDLTATTVTSGSGTVMLIGANDFAAFSPFATSLTGSSGSEVMSVRALPFERARLPHLKLKIAPSVDLGSRGGMYAAVVIRADPIDAADLSLDYMNRFSADYDVIIKHPNAVLSPVTKAITLSIASQAAPRDIRTEWDNNTGFDNKYPSYVLLIAFSDLASKMADVDAGYSPAKSLFEVHMVGSLQLLEPGELNVVYKSGNDTQHASSWATSKISFTNFTRRTLTAFGKSIDVDRELVQRDGTVDIRRLPLEYGEHILTAFDRRDLLLELRAFHLSMEVKK